MPARTDPHDRNLHARPFVGHPNTPIRWALRSFNWVLRRVANHVSYPAIP